MARIFSQRKKLVMKRHLLQEARYTSFRTIMVLASMMKWDLHQMDVKTAFLNGVIEEEVVGHNGHTKRGGESA